VLPREKIASLLDETAQAVVGWTNASSPVDSTQALAGDFKTNMTKSTHHRELRPDHR